MRSTTARVERGWGRVVLGCVASADRVTRLVWSGCGVEVACPTAVLEPDCVRGTFLGSTTAWVRCGLRACGPGRASSVARVLGSPRPRWRASSVVRGPGQRPCPCPGPRRVCRSSAGAHLVPACPGVRVPRVLGCVLVRSEASSARVACPASPGAHWAGASGAAPSRACPACPGARSARALHGLPNPDLPSHALGRTSDVPPF